MMFLLTFRNIDGNESYLFRSREEAHRWLVAEIEVAIRDGEWHPRTYDRGQDDPLTVDGDVAVDIADCVIGHDDDAWDCLGSWAYDDDLIYEGEGIEFTDAPPYLEKPK